MKGANKRLFKATYLNEPDDSDPENKLRVFCIQIWSWYVKLTWSWPEVETGNVDVKVAM